MQKIILFSILSLLVIACKDEQDKVEELKEARRELKELQEKISRLESEIGSSGSSPDIGGITVLVSAFKVEEEVLRHKIEVRGAVESRKNVMISAEMPGIIQRVLVKEGQDVDKGQTLMILEANIIRNNIATLKTQLELAQAVFERQKRLWEQNIGTEIQYLEAKNKKETLETQLATAYAQLDQAVIKAPFSGEIDAIPAREGELTQPGMPLIRLLNPDQMYITSDVSEKYIGRFQPGDSAEVYFPSQNKKVKSTITSVSNVINEENRTFAIEVSLPKTDFYVKPNQVVIVQLQDYKNEDAISVPTKVIRKDRDGSFVYTLEQENNNYQARKTRVSAGISFASRTEITEGLKEGDIVIEKGINDLTNGAQVKLVNDNNTKLQE